MKQFFKPLKGCQMVASDQHPSLKEFDHVGIVKSVEGRIISFVDRSGKVDWLIWRFKEGNNTTVYFGA